jgi:serine/threonine protein kinase
VRRDHAKVLDFGIARLAEVEGQGDAARLTHTGQVIGSPAYMAPEQALNLKVDARTDIYALGIVLYEMVTGRVPFKAASALETLNHHLHTAPTPPSAIRPDLRVPPGLELVILTCLQKKMDARFQTTADLATALADAERQATSGHDAPTDVMATLSDLRRTMVEEGALLAGKEGDDLRRAVGGRGYTMAPDWQAGVPAPQEKPEPKVEPKPEPKPVDPYGGV